MSRVSYPPEYRERLVELVRSGRMPETVAREFEPSAQTIRNWVKQADLDEGVRKDGLSTEERDEVRRLRREVKQLKLERDILKKGRGLVRSGERLDPQAGFEFVKRHQADFPIRTMCRVLGLSTSGYYAWIGRPPSARVVANEALLERMRKIHAFSRCSYGAPRIYAEAAR